MRESVLNVCEIPSKDGLKTSDFLVCSVLFSKENNKNFRDNGYFPFQSNLALNNQWSLHSKVLGRSLNYSANISTIKCFFQFHNHRQTCVLDLHYYRNPHWPRKCEVSACWFGWAEYIFMCLRKIIVLAPTITVSNFLINYLDALNPTLRH